MQPLDLRNNLQTDCRQAVKYLAVGAFLWLALITPASATLIDAIKALSAGDKYRVLFVTSTLTVAISTDIDTYNAFVQSAAASGSVTGPLGLSWKALGSTESVNAQANANIFASDLTAVSIFNTNGDLLAVSGADFWDGALLAPVASDESNFPAPIVGDWFRPSEAFVWTGTNDAGITSHPLGTPSGLDGLVAFGQASVANFWWMERGHLPGIIPERCEVACLPLYGLSSIGTVPSSVPEPSVRPASLNHEAHTLPSCEFGGGLKFI